MRGRVTGETGEKTVHRTFIHPYTLDVDFGAVVLSVSRPCDPDVQGSVHRSLFPESRVGVVEVGILRHCYHD